MSCHRTIIRLSTVLAVVALTKGCGDGENPAAPPTPEPARPTTVTVSPATLSFTRPGSVSIAPGGDIHLRATVKDQNGHPITGADLAWASADTTVVRVDSFGRVEALTLGSTEVTAAAGLVTGRLLITVTHPAYFGTRSTGPFVLSS